MNSILEVYHFETGEIKFFNSIEFFKTAKYKNFRIISQKETKMFKLTATRLGSTCEQIFQTWSAANERSIWLAAQGFTVTIQGA